MKRWLILFLLVAAASLPVVAKQAATNKARAKVKSKVYTYWYKLIDRWSTTSKPQYLYVAQPAPGKAVGAIVWPEKDAAGKPYILYLRMDGTIDKGRIWLSSDNNMRLTGDFVPARFAAAKLTMIDPRDGMVQEYKKAVPPPLKGRPWRDILKEPSDLPFPQ